MNFPPYLKLTTAALLVLIAAATSRAQNPAAESTATSEVTVVKWSEIKDLTYDQRAQFFLGLKSVESAVDVQVAELVARRGAMTSKSDTRDWDFAMKEMTEARAFLKSTGEALSKAPVETWRQEREEVGQAWERTQVAYAKVKASTTS